MNGQPQQGSGHLAGRFLSLRTKFVIFLSLIIIVTCSGLSRYFIQNKTDAMTQQLVNVGTILVRNLAHNSRYGVFTEDKVLLHQFIDGVMEVDEVVYVVVTGPEGRLLAAKSKGELSGGSELARSPEKPVYPAPDSAKAPLGSTSNEPVITPFTAAAGEGLYDFAAPVRRTPPKSPMLPFALESQETLGQETMPMESTAKVYGVVQVGLTSAKMQQALGSVIWNIALLTVLIILAGIAAATALAGRIVTPLRRLALIARRVAEGDLTVSVEPTTRDEVGQLAGLFNQMTQALKERDLSISSHIRTITKQVQELGTLNQTGAAIASTLDIDKLLTTVLRLLVENLGFARLFLMLYDSDRRIAFGARVAGVSEEVERAVRDVELPVQDNGSIHAQLLIHGRPVLVEDLGAEGGRMDPLLFALSRQVGVISFVCAPLMSKQRILGYVGADRGAQRCSQEDLELLITLASHIAVAIDNAQAYRQLEKLTLTLERRVQERTQELQTANEKLQELDRLKSAFVSIASHELRTPMTSIKGYVENMLEGLTGALSEKQAHYLGRVKHNVERLTRLINQLLDLSRLDARVLELILEPLSIHEVVTEVMDSFRPLAQERSLTLSERHAGELPLVLADRDKLNQILTNLIQNAVKFTLSGGRVRVESQVREDGFVQICVVDTGCGIPPHELDKVFERFFRGESAPAEARGTGLGLTISKSLVEMHGGRIWAESTPGKGSRFFFTMPIVDSPTR
jgi:signal transduction histidine kinase